VIDSKLGQRVGAIRCSVGSPVKNGTYVATRRWFSSDRAAARGFILQRNGVLTIGEECPRSKAGAVLRRSNRGRVSHRYLTGTTSPTPRVPECELPERRHSSLTGLRHPHLGSAAHPSARLVWCPANHLHKSVALYLDDDCLFSRLDHRTM